LYIFGASVGNTEVTVEHAPHVFYILDGNGIIQTALLAPLLQLRFGGIAAQCQTGGVAGSERLEKKDQQGDADNHRYHQ